MLISPSFTKTVVRYVIDAEPLYYLTGMVKSRLMKSKREGFLSDAKF